MKVKAYCTQDFVAITPEQTIREVLQAFLDRRQDVACVINLQGELGGIVTKYAIYRLLLMNHSLDTSVQPAIRRSVTCFYEDDPLEHAKDILLEHQVAHGVVLNRNEQVTGVLGKADIIRGFLTETELLLNQLSSLVEHLQDAVITVDKEQRVVTYNQASESLFHLPRENVLGKPVSEVFPQLYGDFLYTLESNEKKGPRRICLAPATVIASFVPLLDWGNTTGAMAVLKDITSYEQVAQELKTTKKLERMLDSALGLSYDGIVITDQNGHITVANQAILELLEQDVTEVSVIGRPLSDVIPDLDVTDTLSRGKKLEGEIRTIHGKKCVITVAPIESSGETEGVIVKVIFHQLEQWKDVFRRLEMLESELTYYRGELTRATQTKTAFDRIISQSPQMEQLKQEAYLASQGVSTVLLTGESGTGKELFAEAIHQESGRPGNFIKVNCAAIPAELLETEFFGYAEGAFTGARKGGKPGKFELADRGTLFLDEIGDMPLVLQAKLLRILQEQSFERVGGVNTKKVDVRIIAATHRDLKQLVKEGRFREDLFYRIHVIHLEIPPLRERQEDIPLLCEALIKKLNQKLKRHVIGITPSTLHLMQNHHWPGNIRELENILERAMLLDQGQWIESRHLPDELQRPAESSSSLTLIGTSSTKAQDEARGGGKKSQNLMADRSQDYKEITKATATSLPLKRQEAMAYAEKKSILHALEKAQGNRTEAARLLNISRATLYQKLKKYNIKEKVTFQSEG